MTYAIENAKMHGKFPLSIDIYEGSVGAVVRIQDSGSGFDYREILEKFRKGKRYYQNGGCGFKHFDEPGHQVSFEGSGNIVNVCSGY